MEEERDHAFTDEYKGRSVRRGSINGTVLVVKYGIVYVSWDVESDLKDYFDLGSLGECLSWWEAWNSSPAAAMEAAAAALEAEVRKQQAANAVPPKTHPATPRSAPASPRTVCSPMLDALRLPDAAPLKLSAVWPDGAHIEAATGGETHPLAAVVAEPGGAEDGGGAVRAGIGVGAADGASALALVPVLDTGQRRRRRKGRRRRHRSDDDGRPGYHQDAPLQVTSAPLEARAAPNASGHWGGTRPPETEPERTLDPEPTPGPTPEPTPRTEPTPKKKEWLPLETPIEWYPRPSSPVLPQTVRRPPSPVPPRTATPLNYSLNDELLDPKTDILQLFAACGENFNPVNLSTAVHQLAKRRSYSDDARCAPLLAAVAACFDADKFKAWELASIALSCCVAGVLEPTLAGAIAAALLITPSQEELEELLDSRGLSHLLAELSAGQVIALATGGALNYPELRGALGLDTASVATLQLALTDVSDELLDQLGLAGRSSLYQVMLYLQLEAPTSPRLLPVLRKRRDVLRAAYVCRDCKPSRSQTDVSRVLDALSWTHKKEWRTAEGLSLDIAKPRQRIAIEFDGPSHYLTRGRPNDATAFKHRLLERLGWRVVHVPYYEWGELRTWNDKKAHLRSKLGATARMRSLTWPP